MTLARDLINLQEIILTVVAGAVLDATMARVDGHAGTSRDLLACDGHRPLEEKTRLPSHLGQPPPAACPGVSTAHPHRRGNILAKLLLLHF